MRGEKNNLNEPNMDHFILASSLTFADDDLLVGVEGQEAVVGSQES